MSQDGSTPSESTAPEGDTGADASQQTAPETQPKQAGSKAAAKTATKAGAKGGTARKTRSVTLTLTVTGTADGEWQAELKHGSTWVARGLEVPAAAVSRAAKELHDELSAPIDEVINAAREQQQAKVAQLEAELEQARQALANLDET